MASLAVGAPPGFLAAVRGSVAASTFSAGVFGVSAVLGCMPELLALVALDWFLLRPVFLAVVPNSFKREAIL